jgi:hypothetical protein
LSDSHRELAWVVAVTLGVSLGLGACKGDLHDLSTEQLSRVVERGTPELKHCYDEALAINAYKQEMRMEAVLQVAPSGRVASVRLNGGGGLPGMADCLRRVIKQWRFPEAKDSTYTSLPLVFHPEVKAAQPNLDTLRQALREVGTGPATGPAKTP